MSEMHTDAAKGLPGETIRRLNSGWKMCMSAAGEFASPEDIPDSAEILDAFVPGTVAEALEYAGKFDREKPFPLDDFDVWYRLSLKGEAKGETILRLEGLATIAEVYLNGALILKSESMFRSYDLPVTLWGDDHLAICFRALAPELERKGPRARWRSQLATPTGLRLFRTTQLGRMPGWCPEVQAVGPWRPVSLVTRSADALKDLNISAMLDEKGIGRLRVSFKDGGKGVIHCAGYRAHLVKDEDRMVAELALPEVAPWWPATHGFPVLHDIELEQNGKLVTIGRTGFRRIEVDYGADGQDFALKVNGQKVFCRGGVWTNADIVRLPGERKDYAPWLERAAEAGMNMIRIGGTMTYESAEFFALCDELGLMVFQDLMFANFDYPVKDADWTASVVTEIEQFLARTSASPSLAIICGGSEVYQQAAMLGLPKVMYEGPLTEEILPGIVSTLRSDCIYIPGSPYGGSMPFSSDSGVSHYYGVGAYMRPLEDARRVNVRFAAESLAFAHVPAQATLDRHLPVQSVHDPRWKARVPRDRGASWDFEDVRDHYLKLLYQVEPERLRRENPALYLDLSRVVTGEVIEETFAEWRRAGSTCNGALIWTFQDLLPGPGWGLIDSTGAPKPVWYAVQRAFRPVQIALTDEGVNGLYVQLINDLDIAVEATVEISCLRDGAVQVVSGKKDVTISPASAATMAATDFFGAFFDTAYAFRFGPPSHDVTIARLLLRETGEEIATGYHFPLGRSTARHMVNLSGSIIEDAEGFAVEISTDRFAQNIEIDIPGFEPEDNWFHLAPSRTRVVRLRGVEARPSGYVRVAGGASAIKVDCSEAPLKLTVV